MKKNIIISMLVMMFLLGGITMAASSNEDITITMLWSGTPYENDFETEQLPKLVHEAFPNITLESTKLPDDQYYTVLKTKLASGEAPDIILVQPGYAGANGVITLAEAGLLAPLTDIESLKYFGPQARDVFTYNGNVYGMPGGLSILGTYYNKDIFQKYNLKFPSNWDEFLVACETLKENGVTPIVMGDKDNYVMQFGLYQIGANGHYKKNPDYDQDLRTGESHFTDQGTWDAILEKYKVLYDNDYIITSSFGLSAQQGIQKFIDGEAAMIFDGSFNIGAIRAKGAVDFERGYLPLAANEPGKDTYASVAIAAGPAITASSDHIDAAKKILDLWYDGQSDIYKASIDTGRSIFSYGYAKGKSDPLYEPFLELFQEGKSFYWFNQQWPSGVNDTMQESFTEAVYGRKDIDGVTKDMQLKLEELLMY